MNEGPRRLRWNVVFAKYLGRGVVKIVKDQRMTINEVEVRIVVAVPGNTDNANFAAELFADLLDRGGFSIASASTRCPKPENHWAFGECGSQRKGCLRADDVCGDVFKRCYLGDRRRRWNDLLSCAI